MSSGGAPSVDRGQLRALLRFYFKLSARETVLMKRRSGPSSFTYVLVMYGIIGVFIGLAAFARPNVILFSVGVHAITFFSVGMAAIIEANEVLFDRREEEILFPLPVHPRTLLIAKSATLVGFVALLAFSLNLGPTFLGLAAADAKPWFPLVHLASVSLMTVFACALVVCVYGLVIRLFGRERFESFAVWAQVGMIVMIIGGFQVVPRLVDEQGAASLERVARWLVPTPPGWFASFDALLAGSARGWSVFAFASVAVLATALLAWIAVARLAGGYGEAAPRAAGTPKPAPESAAAPFRAWRSRNPFLRWWLRDPIEWGAFRLAAAYMRRDREIKLRVYTSLSMFVVLLVMSFLDAQRGRPGFLPLVMLAFAITAGLSSIEALESSSQFAAAEIFASTPIESSAPLFHGVRKACMLFVQLPLTIVSLALVCLSRATPPDPLPLALPVLILLPTTTLLPGAIAPYVPLSKAPRRGEQSSRRVMLVLVTMLGTMGMVGLAYLATRLGWYVPFLAVELVAVVAAHVWLLRTIRERPLLRFAER